MDRGLSLPRLHQPGAGGVQLAARISAGWRAIVQSCVVDAKWRYRQSDRARRGWGGALGWAMVALGGLEIFGGALLGGIWLIFIGLFLRFAAMSEYRGTIVAHLLQHVPVGNIMARDPVTLSPDTRVADAVEQYFLKYGYGGFPVVADGRVIGTLSLPQVRNCSPEDRAQKKVSDIMRALDPAIEITPLVSAMDAVRKMNEADSGRLVVVEDGRLVGLITRSGVMRFIQIRSQLETKTETK